MRKAIMTLCVTVLAFCFMTGLAFGQNDPTADSWLDDGSGTVETPDNAKVNGELSIGNYLTIGRSGYPTYEGNGGVLAFNNNDATGVLSQFIMWGNNMIFAGSGNKAAFEMSPHIDKNTSHLDFIVKAGNDLIVEDGNVAIGTTDPGQYKLAVKGKIRTEEVVVETGWSDFVFEGNYALPSLDKVETYIKENKHLPDIPSEKVIKENGLSMADMMAKQMQKIEELTLYVIELKKENQELSERLVALEQTK